VRADFVAGAILLVVVGVFWTQRDYASRASGLYPDLVLVVLAVLGIAIIVNGYRRGDRALQPRQVDPKMLAGASALVLVWAVLMGLIGFTISGVIAFVAMALLIRRGRPSARVLLTDSAVGAVVVVAVFFIFTRVLLVPLPVSTLIGM
jgi:hypothetical protein